MVSLLVLIGVYNETEVRWQMGLIYLRPWWKWLEVFQSMAGSLCSQCPLDHWDSYCNGLVSLSLLFPVMSSHHLYT